MWLLFLCTISKKVLNFEFYCWNNLSYEVLYVTSCWIFFVSIVGHYNIAFLFWFYWVDVYHLLINSNSFLNTMKVVVFHGSSKIFTFVLMRKCVFNKSKSEYEIIPSQRICKRVAYFMSFFCHICCVNMMLLGRM